MSARIIVVTGTSTEVGKTIVTAALAATAAGSVVVVKPCQTGVATGEPTDAAVVHALTGVDVETFIELPEPLAPDTAARRAGVALPTVEEHAARIRSLADRYDVVIVEGAGGLLVRLDLKEQTLLDLALELSDHAVEVVVVCSAGLGTLNHAELTVDVLRDCVDVAGLVIGSWPADPGLAEQCNLADLPRVTGLPLLGVVPAGAGALAPREFVTRAPSWFAPSSTLEG